MYLGMQNLSEPLSSKSSSSEVGMSFLDVLRRNFSDEIFRNFMCNLDFIDCNRSTNVELGVSVRDFYFLDSFFGLVNNDRFSHLCFDAIRRQDWKTLTLQLNEKYHDNIDDMTKFYQKKYFSRALDIYRNQAEFEEDFKFSLIYADLDKFKSINDDFGHLTGDFTLIKFADIVRDNLRNSDYAFRNGGEEFAFVLPDLDLEGGLEVAERIRKSIDERLMIVDELEDFRAIDVNGFDCENLESILRRDVTCSLGVVSYDNSKDFQSLLLNADKALYNSKNSGRNIVSYIDY